MGFKQLTRIKLFIAAVLLGFVLPAHGAPLKDVKVTEGPGWVKVQITAAGPVHHRVKQLPPGTSDYRSIAIDVWPAYISSSYEPKSTLKVDHGLVAQVRVSQHTANTVRVWVDVIAWPKYCVQAGRYGVTLGIDSTHMQK